MKKIKVTKYICSYCGREFMDEKKAEDCENWHEKPKKIVSFKDGDYDPSGKKGAVTAPKSIRIEMASGNIAVYRFEELFEKEQAAGATDGAEEKEDAEVIETAENKGGDAEDDDSSSLSTEDEEIVSEIKEENTGDDGDELPEIEPETEQENKGLSRFWH